MAAEVAMASWGMNWRICEDAAAQFDIKPVFSGTHW